VARGVPVSSAWPIWADTTKMTDLLGASRVSMREGIRRVIEAGEAARVTKSHVIGEPKKT
jgi:UDP-glucuronate 4-epimerase